MGVAGSGKTTIGKKLAEFLACPFYDADDFHPPSNKEKMSRSEPLTDEDRAPWLEAISKELKGLESGNGLCVLACSALKQKYRDFLSNDLPVRWVYLKGSKDLILKRLKARKGHFADEGLLESQFRDLEEPQNAFVVDIAKDSSEIAAELLKNFKGA